MRFNVSAIFLSFVFGFWRDGCSYPTLFIFTSLKSIVTLPVNFCRVQSPYTLLLRETGAKRCIPDFYSCGVRMTLSCSRRAGHKCCYCLMFLRLKGCGVGKWMCTLYHRAYPAGWKQQRATENIIFNENKVQDKLTPNLCRSNILKYHLSICYEI